MKVTFRCEKCHKEIKADESASGKRGKCPFCGQSTYIPAPVSEEDVIPLQPLDEADETHGIQNIESQKAMDRELRHEMGDTDTSQAPQEPQSDLRSEDLRHIVVSYCMDMSNGQLERTGEHVKKLKRYKYTAIEAVSDFETGKALEPVLDTIPRKVLQGFLSDLKEQLKA